MTTNNSSLNSFASTSIQRLRGLLSTILSSTAKCLTFHGVGGGLLGEQGAESIHKFFNVSGHTYCLIPDKLQ